MDHMNYQTEYLNLRVTMNFALNYKDALIELVNKLQDNTEQELSNNEEDFTTLSINPSEHCSINKSFMNLQLQLYKVWNLQTHLVCM
jgi:hypothetical protein